jgi:hypothetical protein
VNSAEQCYIWWSLTGAAVRTHCHFAFSVPHVHFYIQYALPHIHTTCSSSLSTYLYTLDTTVRHCHFTLTLSTTTDSLNYILHSYFLLRIILPYSSPTTVRHSHSTITTYITPIHNYHYSPLSYNTATLLIDCELLDYDLISLQYTSVRPSYIIVHYSTPLHTSISLYHHLKYLSYTHPTFLTPHLHHPIITNTYPIIQNRSYWYHIIEIRYRTTIIHHSTVPDLSQHISITSSYPITPRHIAIITPSLQIHLIHLFNTPNRTHTSLYDAPIITYHTISLTSI